MPVAAVAAGFEMPKTPADSIALCAKAVASKTEFAWPTLIPGALWLSENGMVDGDFDIVPYAFEFEFR